MAFFYIAISILTTLYIILILSLFTGWKRIKTYKKGQFDPSLVFTSVVIAAKNEENNILELINSLSRQTLSSKAFEIILVNDHSGDKTLQIANKLSSNITNLRVLSLPDGKNGKKQALKYGLANSKGKLIVTTDADCKHNRFWLETIISFYQKYKPKLIIAPVIMLANNSFGKIQALDFLSLMASGAGASGIKKAIMCNGANLAFEKATYLEFEDPCNNKYDSGDDIFLLLNIKKKYRNNILFVKSIEAITFIKAEKTIKEFTRQRTRWASKSSGYRDLEIIVTSILVLLINLSLLLSFVSSIFYTDIWLLFFTQFTAKSIIDFVFLAKTSQYFNIKHLLWYFVPAQLVNVFLIPFIAFCGIIPSSRWK